MSVQLQPVALYSTEKKALAAVGEWSNDLDALPVAVEHEPERGRFAYVLYRVWGVS